MSRLPFIVTLNLADSELKRTVIDTVNVEHNLEAPSKLFTVYLKYTFNIMTMTMTMK